MAYTVEASIVTHADVENGVALLGYGVGKGDYGASQITVVYSVGLTLRKIILSLM